MALTQDDLAQIRLIVENVVKPLQSEVHALRNDIKEIYGMINEIRADLKN